MCDEFQILALPFHQIKPDNSYNKDIKYFTVAAAFRSILLGKAAQLNHGSHNYAFQK